MQIARASAEQGKLPEADSVLNDAYQLTVTAGDAELSADLVSDRGEIRERSGDFAGARTLLIHALEMLEAHLQRAGDVRSASASRRVAEILNRLGRVSLRLGEGEQAQKYLEAALEQAQLSGDHLLPARVLGNLGNAQALTGNSDEALKTLDRALQATRSAGDRLGTAKLLHNLARLHLKAGGRDWAEALARESYELSVEIGWREGEAFGATLLEQLR
jgi:tetratricopeptide (TPR) repeat protein